MKIYVIEGGIGKQIMFTSILPKLAEKHKEKVIVLTAYPDLFYDNPYIYRAISQKTQYAYEDIVSKNDIVYYEPYWNNDFIKKKINLIESWCKGYGIPYSKELKPSIVVPEEYKELALSFKIDNKKLIVVQFTGGQTPLNTDLNKQFKPNGLIKNYKYKYAEKLVELITHVFPNFKIINYTMPNEGMQIKKANILSIPYRAYPAILQESETFIGIDSSLQHMAAAVNKPGIVLWGATSPKQFGYVIHKNITNKCYYDNIHCSRPYLREIGDFVSTSAAWRCSHPTCLDIQPEKVLKELIKLLK